MKLSFLLRVLRSYSLTVQTPLQDAKRSSIAIKGEVLREPALPSFQAASGMADLISPLTFQGHVHHWSLLMLFPHFPVLEGAIPDHLSRPSIDTPLFNKYRCLYCQIYVNHKKLGIKSQAETDTIPSFMELTVSGGDRYWIIHRANGCIIARTMEGKELSPWELITKEPDLVWGIKKASLRKLHFRWDGKWKSK